MPPKKTKPAGPNDADAADADKIEAFVMRYKESRIPLFCDELDQALGRLYRRETFEVDTSCTLLRVAALSTIALRQVPFPEEKDASSFLHSFRRLMRGMIDSTLTFPSPPRIDSVDFSEEDIINTYTLRFAAFAGLVEMPKIPSRLFKQVAQMLSDIPVTRAYLNDEHLPISPNWRRKWSSLPLIPSIIILADACLIMYKRTAVTLHAYTQPGGLADRPVGGATEKKRKSSAKKSVSKLAICKDTKGKGKMAIEAKTTGEEDAVTESEQFIGEGFFSSDEEEDVFEIPAKKNKRQCRGRASEPLPSETIFEASLSLKRPAQSRHSAPVKSVASMETKKVRDGEGIVYDSYDEEEHDWL